MKTIEEAVIDCSINTGLFMSSVIQIAERSFKSGVEFAQGWIPVSEELPETKPNHYKRCISKDILFQTVKNVYLGYYDSELNEWYSNGDLIKSVIEWRPIEYK